MIIVRLALFLIAIGVIYSLFYFGYKMYRSGRIDDEIEERRLAEEEAARAAIAATKYANKKADKTKTKSFLDGN